MRVTMKKLILLIFFIACGNVSEIENQCKPYVPKNIIEIENAVYKKNNLKNQPNIFFYECKKEVIPNICGKTIGWNQPIACNIGYVYEIYITENIKDSCFTLTHEVIHQALYNLKGDSDTEHKNSQFLISKINEICINFEK